MANSEQSEEVLIKIKLKAQSEALAFVERQKMYVDKPVKEARTDIIDEVGELLPRCFKFVCQGVPVSRKQEDTLNLKKCTTEEEGSDGKTFQFAIQVVDGTPEFPERVVKNNNPAILPQSGKSDAFLTPSATSDHDAFEKTCKQIARDVESLEEDIQIARAKLHSLEEVPPPGPWYGTANFTCNNCHFKGHKVTKPCTVPACRDTTSAGFWQCILITKWKSTRPNRNSKLLRKS